MTFQLGEIIPAGEHRVKQRGLGNGVDISTRQKNVQYVVRAPHQNLRVGHRQCLNHSAAESQRLLVAFAGAGERRRLRLVEDASTSHACAQNGISTSAAPSDTIYPTLLWHCGQRRLDELSHWVYIHCQSYLELINAKSSKSRQMNQVFERDGHKIIWGDALEVLTHEIQDDSIDLIFADPPYNIGKDFNGRKDKWKSEGEYRAWCYQWLDLCVRKLKDTGSLYLMAATQNMPYFDIHLRGKLDILSRIVWSYDSSGVQAKRYYGSLYEPILYCVKDKDHYTFNAHDILVDAKTGSQRKLVDYRKPVPALYNTKKVPGNVWHIPRVRYRMGEYENHPTQKPVTLLERIILASSNPGDLVLDPFSGTFTTSFVANKRGRLSIGIEIEEEYVKIGLRRLEILSRYQGQELKREPRSYEVSTQEQWALFER